MNNFDKLIQEITIKHQAKFGVVNLPMEQVAHSIGHLALEVLQRENKDETKMGVHRYDALDK